MTKDEIYEYVFRLNVTALKCMFHRSQLEFWFMVNRAHPTDEIWQALIELEKELP